MKILKAENFIGYSEITGMELYQAGNEVIDSQEARDRGYAFWSDYPKGYPEYPTDGTAQCCGGFGCAICGYTGGY